MCESRPDAGRKPFSGLSCSIEQTAKAIQFGVGSTPESEHGLAECSLLTAYIRASKAWPWRVTSACAFGRIPPAAMCNCQSTRSKFVMSSVTYVRVQTPIPGLAEHSKADRSDYDASQIKGTH